MDMSPRRPHLLRAFYNWLIENQLTPHIVVDVTLPGVMVPMDFARDGQIVLNIAPRAVGNLELNLDAVYFDASFDGTSHSIVAPMASVLAIYARENGVGTMFESEPGYDNAKKHDQDAPVSDELVPTDTLMSAADDSKSDTDSIVPCDDKPPSPRGKRPNLRIIK